MPSVLFVCTANIIRSPMAEAFLKQQVGDRIQPQTWEVSSAGTWAQAGHPSHKIPLELMGELGIDMRGHRSREVNESLLAASDIILVMEQGHKEALCAEFPKHAEKIFLLSEVGGKIRDIVDPVGGSLVDYKATLVEIRNYLQDAPARILAFMQKQEL